MRLQLDSAIAGTESSRSAGIGQTGGAGTDSARIGHGLSSAQDHIQISGPSSALNQMNAERTTRIHQLVTAVQNGSYNVSSARISSAMVQHAVSDSSERG